MEEMTDKLQKFHASKQLSSADRGFEKNDWEVRNLNTEESSEKKSGEQAMKIEGQEK